MPHVLNISAYRFAHLDDPAVLAQRIEERALADGLRGTVLLAGEGINLFVAGPADTVRGFVAWLREMPALAGLETKESWSENPPFGKLRVKVKPEIIRMNHPAVQPQSGRAPAVDATTLARWLDQGHDDDGRPVLMLDTRNDFEVGHGRFRDAVHWQLDKFSDFPQAVAEHAEALRGKTVVSYCTGGIRCEKAALFMREIGVEHVLQLDGGILKYFEETGGAHFEGNCFVFDERRAVDRHLAAAPPV